MSAQQLRERPADQLRPLHIEPNVLDYPAGSALVRWGRTQVLCAASVEERVPRWRLDSGHGWLSGSYAMLPASTNTRKDRERSRADSRSLEIGRLVGRSLRAMVDMSRWGQLTVRVDCDVIQADGGTRCAAITGGAVAVQLAMGRLVAKGRLPASVLGPRIVAVSVGLLAGHALLDLDYHDDHRADVDMNFVLAADGRIVELQGAAEGEPFTWEDLERMASLARGALPALLAVQQQALQPTGVDASDRAAGGA